MIFNQTVDLDLNGDPVSTYISETQVKSYISDFVSDKSSLYSLIDNNYEITVDVASMNLEGIKFFIFFLNFLITRQINRKKIKKNLK